MDAFYGRKVRLQAFEALSHLHIALFFLIFSLLYPSPLILGPSVESDRGRGGMGIWGGGRNYSRNVLLLPPRRMHGLV